MSAPRTYKQASFIESLLSERLVTLGAETLAEATQKVHLDALSVADAKTIITRLMAMPRDPDTTMPTVVAQSPRSGVNDRPGACDACKGFVDARQGFFYKLSSGGWGVHHKVGECGEPTPDALPLAQINEGFYVIDKGNGLDPDDLEEVDVYKLYFPRNGHLAAKILQGTSWVYRTGGVSVVRAMATVGKARALTHEEAAAFGKITGTCIACALTLTDERSLDVGYGPVCAKRWDWPWG